MQQPVGTWGKISTQVAEGISKEKGKAQERGKGSQSNNTD